jgi:MSHA biogenesis protein MshL
MTFRSFGALSVALVLLAGCGLAPLEPSEAHLRAPTEPVQGSIPPPVQLAPLLPKPKPTARAETYSVVVHNVPVQDLLFALARDARVQVDINPDVIGNVTLNAIDQTLEQLLARIARQVDMRYEVKGGTLVIQRDTPFLRGYRIDYVNLSREGSVNGTLASNVTGSSAQGGASGGGGGGQSNTTTSIKAESNNRFWQSLEQNVKEILRETDKIVSSAAQGTPASAPVTPAAGAQAQGAQPTQVASAGPAVVYREAASVIVNKESGILTVRATSRQHEKIQEFLDEVMANARRQVQIEATVVEVQLNNNYQRGIDWRILNTSSPWNLTNQSSGNFPFNAANTGGLTIGYLSGSISVNIRLLEQFGEIRVLSSPTISAINNQIAVLKVVDNVVYFEVRSNVSQQANAGAISTFETTPRTVPVGFVMGVVPQISENSTISLLVRPSISRITRFVTDPNPALTATDNQGNRILNQVPQIQTREMESVLRLQDGQMAVLGGLMQDESNNTEGTVPGVRSVPLLGELFAQRNDTNTKSELVIFLRATIIRDASIEGDYREFRRYLPEDDFFSKPNPGRVAPIVKPRKKGE